MQEEIQRLADWIVESRRIVVFTGAGVSTESGIPDFRGPEGIWNQYDPADFTIGRFMGSAETRKKHWEFYRSGMLVDTSILPNRAHYAIADLYKLGKLVCIITQNIDDLHQRAGVPAERVIELHGNMKWVKCLSCGHRLPMESVIDRVKAEDLDEPLCNKCRGILKPEGIFFGEALPEEALHQAIHYSHNCDLFLVVGSTLLVTPAAHMPAYALEGGATLVVLNIGPTPMDSRAAMVVNAKAGEFMQQVMEEVKQRGN